MFMWPAIWVFVFTASSWVISLSFYNDAKAEKNVTVMKAHDITHLCSIIGFIVTIILVIAAVKYG